jgi:hypothetical protein
MRASTPIRRRHQVEVVPNPHVAEDRVGKPIVGMPPFSSNIEEYPRLGRIFRRITGDGRQAANDLVRRRAEPRMELRFKNSSAPKSVGHDIAGRVNADDRASSWRFLNSSIERIVKSPSIGDRNVAILLRWPSP